MGGVGLGDAICVLIGLSALPHLRPRKTAKRPFAKAPQVLCACTGIAKIRVGLPVLRPFVSGFGATKGKGTGAAADFFWGRSPF